MHAQQELAITAQTRLLGVIGHPVGHSLSPRIHNAALRAQGIDMVYLAFEVAPARLSEAVGGMRALGVRGVNVTIPHKEAIVGLLDEVDPAASQVGAVNTVVNEKGRLTGYNTDVTGFAAALRGVLPQGAQGLHCLVVGAGGAARAVVAALVADRAASIAVYNRTAERAARLCRAAVEWGAIDCRAITRAQLRGLVAEADLLVNATSIGLVSEIKDFPVSVDTLHSGLVVADLVYGRGSTGLIRAAVDRGARIVDGTAMLLMQAGRSYRLWTGLEPPLEVMRASVEHQER